jgi:hypothetical protein
MVETDVHSCLILDIRKKTNGRSIYLDQTKLAHFVRQVSNKGNGFASLIEMDLGGIKVLGAERSWVDGPDSIDGIGFDASNQTLQEIVELKNLAGSSRDIGPLGKGGRVGSVGCDPHAIGIQGY